MFLRFSRDWKSGFAVGLTALLVSVASAEKPLAVWDVRVLAEGGAGFRKNVLRSAVAVEDSGFFQSTVDASLMRLSESEALLMIYLFGDDIRYFDAPAVHYEQMFSGTVYWSRPVGPKGRAELRANYLYQHQVFDASATEVLVRRVLVLGHSATLHPGWEYRMNERWTAALEGIGGRQVYEHTLDAFSEGGALLRLERAYGHHSAAELRLRSVYRLYDSREQYSTAGLPVPGTDLTYLQTEGEVRWNHYFDSARDWRISSRISGLTNRDNGSGYFDYDRLLFREQFRWSGRVWSVRTSVRAGLYRHRVQEIGGERRRRSNIIIEGRLERGLGAHWTLYAQAEQEWSRSNDPRDEYTSWMAGTGAGFEF